MAGAARRRSDAAPALRNRLPQRTSRKIRQYRWAKPSTRHGGWEPGGGPLTGDRAAPAEHRLRGLAAALLDGNGSARAIHPRAAWDAGRHWSLIDATTCTWTSPLGLTPTSPNGFPPMSAGDTRERSVHRTPCRRRPHGCGVGSVTNGTSSQQSFTPWRRVPNATGAQAIRTGRSFGLADLGRRQRAWIDLLAPRFAGALDLEEATIGHHTCRRKITCPARWRRN